VAVRRLEQRFREDDRVTHTVHDQVHKLDDRFLLGRRQTRAKYRDEVVDVRFRTPIASESTELTVTGNEYRADPVESGNGNSGAGKINPPLAELFEYFCRGRGEAREYVVDIDRTDQCRMLQSHEDRRQKPPGASGRGERPADFLENHHEVKLVEGRHNHDRRRRYPRRHTAELEEDGPPAARARIPCSWHSCQIKPARRSLSLRRRAWSDPFVVAPGHCGAESVTITPP
jgi:hypothetical protein